MRLSKIASIDYDNRLGTIRSFDKNENAIFRWSADFDNDFAEVTEGKIVQYEIADDEENKNLVKSLVLLRGGVECSLPVLGNAVLDDSLEEGEIREPDMQTDSAETPTPYHETPSNGIPFLEISKTDLRAKLQRSQRVVYICGNNDQDSANMAECFEENTEKCESDQDDLRQVISKHRLYRSHEKQKRDYEGTEKDKWNNEGMFIEENNIQKIHNSALIIKKDAIREEGKLETEKRQLISLDQEDLVEKRQNISCSNVHNIDILINRQNISSLEACSASHDDKRNDTSARNQQEYRRSRYSDNKRISPLGKKSSKYNIWSSRSRHESKDSSTAIYAGENSRRSSSYGESSTIMHDDENSLRSNKYGDNRIEIHWHEDFRRGGRLRDNRTEIHDSENSRGNDRLGYCNTEMHADENSRSSRYGDGSIEMYADENSRRSTKSRDSTAKIHTDENLRSTRSEDNNAEMHDVENSRRSIRYGFNSIEIHGKKNFQRCGRSMDNSSEIHDGDNSRRKFRSGYGNTEVHADENSRRSSKYGYRSIKVYADGNSRKITRSRESSVEIHTDENPRRSTRSGDSSDEMHADEKSPRSSQYRENNTEIHGHENFRRSVRSRDNSTEIYAGENSRRSDRSGYCDAKRHGDEKSQRSSRYGDSSTEMYGDENLQKSARSRDSSVEIDTNENPRTSTKSGDTSAEMHDYENSASTTRSGDCNIERHTVGNLHNSTEMHSRRSSSSSPLTLIPPLKRRKRTDSSPKAQSSSLQVDENVVRAPNYRTSESALMFNVVRQEALKSKPVTAEIEKDTTMTGKLHRNETRHHSDSSEKPVLMNMGVQQNCKRKISDKDATRAKESSKRNEQTKRAKRDNTDERSQYLTVNENSISKKSQYNLRTSNCLELTSTLVTQQEARFGDKANIKKSESYLQGVIDSLEEEDNDSPIGFIKPDKSLPLGWRDSKKVKFFFRNVKPSQNLIKPQKGDRVHFVLGERDKSKSHAVRVYITQYHNARTPEELEKVLQTIKLEITKSAENKVGVGLVEILNGAEIWKCFCNCQKLSDKAIRLMIDALTQVHKQSIAMKENFKYLVQSITNTNLFDARCGCLFSFTENAVRQQSEDILVEIRSFLLMVALNVPSKITAILPILKLMVSRNETTTESCLYTLLHAACKEYVGHQFGDYSIPLVLSHTEMLQEAPIKLLSQLHPILLQGAYSSPEEYVDICFKLLRADCLYSLGQGIKHVMQGNLSDKSICAYYVKDFYGIHLESTEIAYGIALRVMSTRAVKSWKRSKRLMFGNLVCLSVDGTFQDAIWATVVSRDLMEKESIVVLELCSECNCRDDGQAIQYLEKIDSRSLLVESTTHYRSYQPILRSLQSMDLKNLPFQAEIVQGKNSSCKPDFIDKETTIDGNIIFNTCDRIKINLVDLTEKTASYTTELDKSQEHAFLESLSKRIAIIQGPPGTGKTFMGVKLARAIESLSTRPDSPILVLTYKNHALDEFLKQIANYYEDGVVRVGGKQRNNDTGVYNLAKLKWMTARGKDLDSRIKDCKNELEEEKKYAANAFSSISQRKSLTSEMIATYMTENQLQTFLLGFKWSNYNFKSIKSLLAGNKSLLRDKNSIIEKLAPVKKFLLSHHDDSNDRWVKRELMTVIARGIREWYPEGLELQTIQNKLQKAFDETSVQPVTVQNSDEEDDFVEMEEELARIEEERMAVTGRCDGNVLIENIIKFRIEKTPGSSWMPTMFPLRTDYANNSKYLEKLGKMNPWDMRQEDKVYFIQNIMNKEVTSSAQRMTDVLLDYKASLRRKIELETLHKLLILQEKKFVCMTITGASIQRDLLSQLKPAVVIVEEAAEIMEPQLLGCLGPWVKQLILIGDHKQLRPRVETYDLCKKYNLDISLMERLINNNLPFTTLTHQSRMRPEFADMLKDIYPELESNMDVVKAHNPPNCIAKSMFFWTHRSEESLASESTSYTNQEEVKRCVKLALYLIHMGHKPSAVTILAAYLQQVRLIRKEMDSEMANPLQKITTNNGGCFRGTEQKVNIQSIDNYQGDENDIVIVSLVRSNQKGIRGLGFLDTLNRRCVAQSRAKCGMYFVGNEETLQHSKHWRPVISAMTIRGELGESVPLQCPKHTANKLYVDSADAIPKGKFCDKPCDVLMSCEKHKCKEKCSAEHTHFSCEEMVNFTFDKCEHQGIKLCWESKEWLKCKKTFFKKLKCTHMKKMFCYEEDNQVKCFQKVRCTLSCGHKTAKSCFKKVEEITCTERCNKSYEECGHPCLGRCAEPCNPLDCHVCEKLRATEIEAQRQTEKENRKQKLAILEQEITQLRKKKETEQCIQLSHDDPEFDEVKDIAVRFIKPNCSWFPKVTDIYKLWNKELSTEFLKCHKSLKDPVKESQLKFHDASAESIENIRNFGFSTFTTAANKGIAFCNSSLQAPEKIFKRGGGKLLMCKVLLGNAYCVSSEDKEEITAQNVKNLGFDSMYVRGTSKREVDHFVIYNVYQAIPKYIIHFEKSVATMQLHPSYTGFKKFSINPSRSFKVDDFLEYHLRIVQSNLFNLKHKYRGRALPDLKSVDFYQNPELMERYKAKQKEFEDKYGEDNDSCNEVLAFHGTKPKNVENIVRRNFDTSKIRRTVHGHGFYFSEFPEVTKNYGTALLLCRVLPGKAYEEKLVQRNKIPQGHDSIAVNPDPDHRAEMLVIANPDQILPCYRVHLK